MQDIIKPIDKNFLIGELSKHGPVKVTKRLEDELYIVSATDCPYVMLELGRLREVTFRAAQGGTGKEVDIDEYDYLFKHLVLWSSQNQEIKGSYRLARMIDLKDGPIIHSPTAKLFDYSKKFIREYLPTTIELGRSFIRPEYQPKNGDKSGVFSLFNLFTGLEYILSDNPDIKYLFGKFTMYSNYDVRARNLLLNFLRHKFPDPERLVRPKKDFRLSYAKANLVYLQSIISQHSFDDQTKILENYLSQYGEFLQPLVKIYMSLSPTMKSFRTAYHKDFGNTYETGILIYVPDIHPEIINKYRKNIKE